MLITGSPPTPDKEHDMTAKPVIAGVDGSPSSVSAAEHAAVAAISRSAPLVLVHGYLHPRGYGSAPLEPYQAYPPPPPAHGDAMLSDLAGSLRSHHPGLAVSHKQLLGGGAATMVEESREADLVVVGCRGHGSLAGLLLGSVSSQVVAHAHCPVLVVRPAEAAMPAGGSPVVVGVDGSPASTLALERAAGEAARRGLPLTVVHAAEADTSRAEEMLAQTAGAARAAHPDLTVETRVLPHTDAAAGLVDASKDAAMVVVGSRGRGGFAGLLLGSVSQTLVHHSQCPVLVIPPHVSGD
jgi:nucleotide-binding universal stress UspA family protein